MTDGSNHEIDRRKWFRLDMEKEFIDLEWQDPQGQKRTKKVTCSDFSRGGIRIESDMAMDIDLSVNVVFKGYSPHPKSLKGKVIRCVLQANGWYDIAFIMDVDSKK